MNPIFGLLAMIGMFHAVHFFGVLAPYQHPILCGTIIMWILASLILGHIQNKKEKYDDRLTCDK